jgi:hypothetical protein
VNPVMQSKLWTPDAPLRGNCNAASLASILEIPLWMVPPFEDMRGDLQEERRNEWLQRMFGLELVRTHGHQPSQLPEFYIACGPSPRGGGRPHLPRVVYRAGELAHDPHPSGAGITAVEWTWHLAEATPC